MTLTGRLRQSAEVFIRVINTDRRNALLMIIRIYLAVAFVLSPFVVARGVYDQYWQESMVRDGIAATGQMKRLTKYRNFDLADITWKDGKIVRAARVSVSRDYAEKLDTQQIHTVPILYRGAAVVIADDAAENTLYAGRIRPALAIAVLSFFGLLVLRRQIE